MEIGKDSSTTGRRSLVDDSLLRSGLLNVEIVFVEFILSVHRWQYYLCCCNVSEQPACSQAQLTALSRSLTTPSVWGERRPVVGVAALECRPASIDVQVLTPDCVAPCVLYYRLELPFYLLPRGASHRK